LYIGIFNIFIQNVHLLVESTDINVNMNAKFEKMQMQETIDSWLVETERRCPVTDNIQSMTNIALHLN
jgi:hypothetical protein